MESLVRELEQILGREIGLHEELVAAAVKMGTALREQNETEVRTCSQFYDDISLRIEAQEEQRLATCDSLVKKLRPGQGHLNLREILRLLPDPLKNTLKELGTTLKGRVDELSRINLANQVLLEEKLREIATTFELITRQRSLPAGYGKGGRSDAPVTRKPLINRIA